MSRRQLITANALDRVIGRSIVQCFWSRTEARNTICKAFAWSFLFRSPWTPAACCHHRSLSRRNPVVECVRTYVRGVLNHTVTRDRGESRHCKYSTNLYRRLSHQNQCQNHRNSTHYRLQSCTYTVPVKSLPVLPTGTVSIRTVRCYVRACVRT